jgi:sRNA-binding carbon storage regulator CsrA
MLAVSRRQGEQVLIEDVTLTVESIAAGEVQMALQKRDSVPVMVTLKPTQFVNACYNVRIGVVRVQGDKVRLGFEIPPTVKIARL